MTPKKVLFFVLICLGLLCGLSLIFPKDGIDMGKAGTLRFMSLSQLFMDTVVYKDASFALDIRRDSLFIRDSLNIADSLKIFRNDPGDSSRIKYPDAHKEILYPFFAALDSVRTDQKSLLRVVHYGDSQIEGDRISGYLRDRLQELFGGSGAGLVPAVQPIGSASVFQSASENWTRYAIFGSTEQRAPHRRYGAMLAVCSYTGNSASVRFSKSNIGYERNKDIRTVRIYYGNCPKGTSIALNGKSARLEAGSDVHMTRLSFESLPNSFTLQFNGASPEVYGIALDGGPGVTVDNIPMRGSAGTRFTAVDKSGYKRMMTLMNARLVLMEFGGNMLPSIGGPKSVENYKTEFKSQLEYVKSVAPGASIITIGPADMSKRVNAQLQTWPYLEDVRTALREASFESGCGFWDMYAVMGGRNSMPGWVKQKLAGTDYIHFTRNGAEKIAELFTKALIDDYNEYRLRMQMQNLQTRADQKKSEEK